MMESSGPTRFNQEKLRNALQDLSDIQTAVTQEQEVQRGFPQYDFFKLTPELQKEHFRKADLYKEAGGLREQLILATTDQERAEIAGPIVAKMNENTSIWMKLDYFIQHGQPMKETKILIPELEGMSTAELARFKTNNASNLSKWKRKLTGLQGSEKEQMAEKIRQFIVLQEQAKKMLNEQ